MASEAFAEAARCHANFQSLLKSLMTEHQHLWSHTQAMAQHSFGFDACQDGRQIDCILSSHSGLSNHLYRAPALETPRSPRITSLFSPPSLSGGHTGEYEGSELRFYKHIPFEAQTPPLSPRSTKEVTMTADDVDLGETLEQGDSTQVLILPRVETGSISSEDRSELMAKSTKRSAHMVLSGSMVAEHSALLLNMEQAVLYRLQARLGVREGHEMITAKHLFDTVKSLGLDRYSESQVGRLVMRLSRVGGSDWGCEGGVEDEDPATGSFATCPTRRKTRSLRSNTALLNRGFTILSNALSSDTGASECRKIRFNVLLRFLTVEDAAKLIGSDFESMFYVIKEVLLSGDANRLVAELTSVRVDDLAAPPPRTDWEAVFEPVVGCVIIVNAVVIGLQTDAGLESWEGWMWVEACFTLFFLFEIVLRIRMLGVTEYYTGRDARWSFFDTSIVMIAVCDTTLDFSSLQGEVASLTIIRTVRLTRLSRLVRILRLNFLKELSLLVKGLIAGFRTLFWAFVLLFLTIYILAVLATLTIGKDPGNQIVEREKLFKSLPRSMFTCFRCFIGDCTTSKGEPIVKLLSDAHGVTFATCYVFSITFVTLGLFNLIMALYVEITMAAAKRTEDFDRKRRERESLRVAHLTKRLLKKFCVAQHVTLDRLESQSTSQQQVSQSLRNTRHVDLNTEITISKELFLLIVQDPEVQRIMNELDIPPDRANLFDVLDADGTGDLHVTELVHGLLKVRGEARKSDIVASLLAVRAVQDMIRLLEKRMLAGQESLMEHLGGPAPEQSRTTIWDHRKDFRSTASRLSNELSSHGSGVGYRART